jgi:hypothetical protein
MKRIILPVHLAVPELGLEEGDIVTVDTSNPAEPSFVLKRALPGDFIKKCWGLMNAINDAKVRDQNGAEDRPYWALHRIAWDYLQHQQAEQQAA